MDPEELSEALARADLVAEQIRGLASGELQPEDIVTPGAWAHDAARASVSRSVLTPASASADAAAAERASALALQRKWDDERAARLAAEERERWWKFARMQFGDDGVNAPPPPPSSIATVRPAAPTRGRIDYAWWDAWAASPDDAVTIAEDARIAADAERAANEAFEKANAGFVASFNKDQAERDAAEARKQTRAAAHRARGNAAFTARDLKGALASYHEALRLCPFSVPVLNNAAACHLALDDWPGAREFTTRVLFIEPASSPAGVKALFRRAHAARSCGDLTVALSDLSAAASHEPGNAEVVRDLRALRLELSESAKEAAAAAAIADDVSTAAISPASPGIASDGLPSASAISSVVELAAMEAPALIARAKARMALLAALPTALLPPKAAPVPPSGPQPPASDASARDELRTASRELRAVTARLSTDETRVAARTSGLLHAAGAHLCAYAAALSVQGFNAPSPWRCGGLAHMALAAGCVQLLTAGAANPKNRLLLRTRCECCAVQPAPASPRDSLEGSPLGAVLQLLSMHDESAADAWSACFGVEFSASGPSSTGAPPTVAAWLPQLHSTCATLVDAFASPCGDPDGRAALVRHPFVASTWRNDGGGRHAVDLVYRLRSGAVAVLSAPPGALGAGVLECLAAYADTLQHLCVLDTSPALTTAVVTAHGSAKGGGDDPFAALHMAVISAIDALGDAPADASGELTRHPLTALLQLATALVARAVIDGPELLWCPAMVGAIGAAANLAQRPRLRRAMLVPARAIRVGGASASSASSSASAMPLALHPLLDVLRLQLPAPLPYHWDLVRGSALAAIANACLEGTAATDAIAGTGAVPILLALLLTGSGSSAPLSPEVRARAALLVGRLASAAGAAEAVRTPARVKQLVALLAASTAVAAGHAPSGAADGGASSRAASALDSEGMYQDGLLRLLAAAVTSSVSANAGGDVAPPATEDSATTTALYEAGALRVIVNVLRAALPSLVAAKHAVPGAPLPRARMVGVGNGCRVLIALSALPDAPHAFLGTHDAVEVLVEALKSPGPDGAPASVGVRKNAAVVLARLARDKDCLARIRELRGLEVLMACSEELGVAKKRVA